MHWILQHRFFNASAFQILIGTLERFELPYSVHKVTPFTGELTDPAAPEVEGRVICMGSYSMRHVGGLQGGEEVSLAAASRSGRDIKAPDEIRGFGWSSKTQDGRGENTAVLVDESARIG